ncbi:dihydrolipoyl dehydrogenase [Immundisolibacter sp.]|uniref:dihydrolipoyl dehydrogenase n=2 Tax=Immundisolibacter sp. TaxID=1934948 RepID=UPI00262C4F7B|nr:dihydrolipoyl dehydrogenase [Immundisolibacter sp.]MDD3652293.1 dihydrolipoyl dehydrogenase [Immundisolibacter sp.]
MPETIRTQLVVVGAGPGGYSAAFRAADLGLEVTLVEREQRLGGVCLNVGCIPSKALLHIAKVIDEAAHTPGVDFGKPKIDLDGVRGHKDKVVKRLTDGLAALARQRKVRVLTGSASFKGPNSLRVAGSDGTTELQFEHAIVATGSTPARIPGLPDDPRVMDSTGALALEDVPGKLLVIGGGYIGLEMATVYRALGSAVSVVEFMDGLLPGADADLVKPLAKRLAGQFAEIRLKTKVTGVVAHKDGIEVSFEGPDGAANARHDRVLVAVGRRPNGQNLGLEALGVRVTERGFIEVDAERRTAVKNIFAIGDVAGEPMLAHKAAHEGKVAAEVIAGHKAAFAPLAIPAVVFTDPEIAWAGLTENQARKDGTAYEKATFPWAANGRSLTLGRDEGLTKILFEPKSRRVLGVGIVGPGAGDLIAEGVLAIEMGADAQDLALTIHPHPTLSETIGMAAEVFDGSVTDIIAPKRR